MKNMILLVGIYMVIIILIMSGVWISYKVGYEKGMEKMSNETLVAGANAGMNYMAQEMCVNQKTFYCDNELTILCGCFQMKGSD